MKKAATLLLLALCTMAWSLPPRYLSPVAIAVDARKALIYTALSTDGTIAVTDAATGVTTGKITLRQNPNGLLLSHDGKTLFAATGEANGSVEFIVGGKVKSSVSVGHTPTGMALTADGKTLYVANRFSNTIAAIDVAKRKIVAEIPAVREPRSVVLTPDGQTLAVGNFLPAQAATDEVVASEITLIDPHTNKVRTQITLPSGSQSLWGMTCSADGRFLYCVHLLSRFSVPVTQLDRGWVNTNALSIIDLNANAHYATVLLDDIDRGAANPTGLCLAPDGSLAIALSGTHELLKVDLNNLHKTLNNLFGGKSNDPYVKNKDDLTVSLTFTMPFKTRIALKGRLPRDIAALGNKLFVACLYSPFLEAIDLSALSGKDHTIIALGEEPAPDEIRRGELAYNDASICYQQWQTCASCHPDGRADGLNWDQQNDGLGNPKNTKTLLYSHVTPPCMITGIRKSAEIAVRSGILHTFETTQSESVAASIDAYLKSLKALESPYLKTCTQKDPQGRGKQLFQQAGCADCHNGTYFTDMQLYDVGTGDGNDLNRRFDTPALREVWRTAPYLYDGRAATLEDVFTKFNKNDRHGVTSKLNQSDFDALILYLKTL